ncbi:MAG: transglutaminase-like domain-containing protein [Bacteroidales bacterium]|nr:transglutaminase-like domain-containing protein [Bacteroidales bacterium]
MKKSVWLCLLLGLLVFSSSCNRNKHFITDSTYRKKVESQFEKQKMLAGSRKEELFHVFDQKLSLKEKEALEFLYAYMPLSDLADYNGDFYLKNVRASFAARDTFEWGKKVPEILFRHFVLPIRVNNENLDSSRWIFFMEMKDRIKKLSMKDAVLEVNHWCHEKVTYQGTDGRTSSPLATVKTAFGRCGEESTFTVAALRSVGIPARQCYTPRWAHSDDNHAWVEVWVDGKWHFIGACEPDIDLDLAWFTGPAKRAMLVNTNVFGDYEGPEDILQKDERYTKINILSNYAETKRLYAKVVDDNNHPVDSAIVEFQLYNYAEFYPLHKDFTNHKGITSLLTGYGDLILWASKNGKFGYVKASVKSTDTAIIKLSMKPGTDISDAFDLTPPPEMAVKVKPNDSLKSLNLKKIEFEDKIRSNYESTFIDSTKTFRLAKQLQLNPDTLWYFLKRSRGNWREIIDFITGVSKQQKSFIFPLLQSISQKDLRDITTEVLSDNIIQAKSNNPDILSPRVDNEWLKPYKSFFNKKIDGKFVKKFQQQPDSLVVWLKANIRIDNSSNYGRAPLTPIGSYELKVTDLHSLDILFVALCRSFDIPARLEPGTRIPQYSKDGKWKDVYFEKPIEVSNTRGTLTLMSNKKNGINPEYYVHFTIEKYGDGFFRSLDYETDPIVKNFPCTLSLAPGYYLIVTGSRLSGGKVLVNLHTFQLKKDQKQEADLLLRKDLAPLPVFGTIDVKALINDLKENTSVSIRQGIPLILAWLEPEKEPTKHFIADLEQKKSEIERWHGKMILLFKNINDKNDFEKKYRSTLPDGIHTFIAQPSTLKMVIAAMKHSENTLLPFILYITPDGRIHYFSEGYKIGVVNDLISVLQFQ